jgi:hypothetical protein
MKLRRRLGRWKRDYLAVQRAFSQGEWKAEISPQAILMGFAFTTAVGIFFGFIRR